MIPIVITAVATIGAIAAAAAFHEENKNKSSRQKFNPSKEERALNELYDKITMIEKTMETLESTSNLLKEKIYHIKRYTNFIKDGLKLENIMLDDWFISGIVLNEKLNELVSDVASKSRVMLEADQKIHKAYLIYITKKGFFSQEEIRSYLDVSPSAVSSWLSGKKLMSSENQHKITLFFLATSHKVFQLVDYNLKKNNTNMLQLDPIQRVEIFNNYRELIGSDVPDVINKYCKTIIRELTGSDVPDVLNKYCKTIINERDACNNSHESD